MSYSKYYVYKEQISTDGGASWQYTGNETPSGESIGTYSTLQECESGSGGYENQYLTIVPVGDGKIEFRNYNEVFYYSYDSGSTWIEATYNTKINMTTGEKIMFKGTLTPEPNVNGGIGSFSANTGINVEGNPMSMLFGDNFRGQTDLTGKDYAFTELFWNVSNVRNIDNFVLPATTLSEGCYGVMFHDCKSLTRIPSGLLPATTLAKDCYSMMFEGCTSLTTVPSNLLPATTLESNCYRQMFKNCTSLVSVPSNLLPATTLANACYNQMFYGCTSLTTAPELPATTLTRWCYANMFDYCSSLNKITCMAQSGINTNYSTNFWVEGVSSTGTFYKKAGVSWPSGDSGIPTGWTVVEVQ